MIDIKIIHNMIKTLFYISGDVTPLAYDEVLQNISTTVVAMLMAGAAHRLIIRLANHNDPPSASKV